MLIASEIFHSEPVSDVIQLYWKQENFWRSVTKSELYYKKIFHATFGFVVNGGIIVLIIICGGLRYESCWENLPMQKAFIRKTDERNKVKINNN